MTYTLKRALTASACALSFAVLAASPVFAQEDLQKMSKDSNNWVIPLGNYASQRYSDLKQINTTTAAKLHPVWTFSTGVLRGHEGGPLVIGDMMYLSTPFPNTVFALDLNHEGRIVWKYEPKQDSNVIPVMCCDTVNRGVAYGGGMIFLHQADTTLVALDAKTGKVAWTVKDGDAGRGETGTSAPLVVKDKVYIGVSGGEFGIQGRLTAYNIKDGSKAWVAYSSGTDDMIKFDPNTTTELGHPVGANSSVKTWKGDQWKNGGGGTWGWISYDPALNMVYYGSATPAPGTRRSAPATTNGR